MNARKNIAGKRFGRLIAISYQFSIGGRAYWLCQCDCGRKKTVRALNLNENIKTSVRSCGCLRSEQARRATLLVRKHGESTVKTPEYLTWINIRVRCYDTRTPNWKYYGEQGVIVCDRWLYSYENFLADMGRRPSRRHSIDRYPDPYGNYSPENCRWATAKEQRINQRKELRYESGDNPSRP